MLKKIQKKAAGFAKKAIPFFIRNPLLYVLSLWVGVIILTAPNLNRPLSKHHEFNPSLVLICIDNWQAIGGPQHTHFTPLINYQRSADKLPGFSTDKFNQFVNVSFGNLWYLAPYYFHVLFGLKASALSLQAYNLLLLLISLLLINTIAITIGKSCNSISIPLLLPLLYATCPVVSWFCTSGYMHEAAVLPFYFGSIIVLHKVFVLKHYRPVNILLVLILFIAGTLTDWLFAPFCCIICLHAFISFIKTKERYLLAIIMASITGFVIAGAIILYCYTQQMGLQPLLEVTRSRWQDRGISAPDVSLMTIAQNMAKNYLAGLAALLPVIGLLCIKNIREKIWIVFKNTEVRFFALVTLGTGLLHQIIFLQFSYIHDYSVLKMAFPFALLVSIILATQSFKIKWWATFAVVVINIGVYYAINRPGKIAQNGDEYNYLEVLGKDIAKTVASDEIVMIKEVLLMPQLIFYSKRNYIRVADEREGLLYMQQNHFKKGCFITLNNWKISAVTHLCL